METANLEFSLEEPLIQCVVSYGDIQIQTVDLNSVSTIFWHHMKTTNSVGILEERLMQCLASYGDNNLRKQSRRAAHTICGIIWGQQTQTVNLKSISHNVWHQMRTTNSEGSLGEHFIQFVASYGDNKLRTYCRRAGHTSCGVIWKQQTQKVVQKSGPYNLWHHKVTINTEGSLEERQIQIVASYGEHKLRKQSRRALYTIFCIIW